MSTAVLLNPHRFASGLVGSSVVQSTIGNVAITDTNPYNTEVLTDSPLIYLPLNDPSGTTATALTGSSGTYVGSPTLNAAGPSSRIPYAVSFDGSNDCVTLPNLAFTGSTSPQTIEFWAKTGATINSATTVLGPFIKDTSPNGGIYLGSATSLLTNEVVTVIPTSGVDERTGWSGLTLSFGWHHYVLTFSGTQNGWTLYIDGVSVGTKISNLGGSRGFTSGSTFTLGRLASTFYALTGIAAFACYDSQLSASRVAAHYNASLAGPPVVSSVKALWWADDINVSDGAAVSSWVDRIGSFNASQGTGGLQPLMRTTGIGSKPAVDFDGSDDYLRYAASNAVSTATSGFWLAVCLFDSVSTQGAICSTADEATTTRHLDLFNNSSGNIRQQQRNNDTDDTMDGDDTLSTATAYVIESSSSGTAWTVRRNNDTQSLSANSGSNTGDWFGDTSARDNFVIGALVRTSAGNPLNGKVALVLVADAALSAGDRTTLYDWISSYYGITMG